MRTARAVSADFQLDDDNAAAVADVCRRVDGLPLGIVLAASRTRVFAPQALLANLPRTVDLRSRARDLPVRHQSLRTTIAWSDALLEAPQREAFHRLAVASGGLDLSAAEALIGPDAAEHVESLVEKSLLVARRAEAGMRFDMLDTIRQYALECLSAAGHADDARSRHARYFVERAERASQDLRGPRQADAIDALQRERDNLHAAFALAVARRRRRTSRASGRRPVAVVGHHRELREGADWMAEALALDNSLAARPRAGALLVIALAALQAGDVGAGMGPLEQSLQLYELAGDDRGAAFALLFLGQTDASRQRFEQVGDVAGEAFALATAAELLVIDDRLDEAASTFQASRLRAEAAEDRRAVAQALNGLGLVELLRGRAQQAHPFLLESATLCLDLGHDGLWFPLMNLAAVELAAGQATSTRSQDVGALTAREREVAALIGQGMTSRQIAETLVITDRTADTHAERIRGKLGLRSRAEIAAWAVRQGIAL